MGDRPLGYEERVVAFMDILGWSDLIVRSRETPGLVRLLSFVSKMLHATTSAESTCTCTHFSDTLVLSCPRGDTDTLLTWLSLVCEQLLFSGTYARGAIVIGEIWHREGSIFGPALIEAYRLESQVAKTPRVLVTDDARRALDPKDEFADLFWQDQDGLWFLNYLGFCTEFVRDHPQDGVPESIRQIIEKKIKYNHDNAAVVAKLRWMLGYVDKVQTVLAAKPPRYWDED
jgi:hypothetical protein